MSVRYYCFITIHNCNIFKIPKQISLCRNKDILQNREIKKLPVLPDELNKKISGKPLYRLSNPFGKVIPERLSMPMESILPAFALQNGHIFLGFTECGRFILSYTIREEYENAYNRNELTFFYKLCIWLFTPYKTLKRVASTILFSNTGVADNNLLINVSQWKNDDSRLVITGRNCSPEIGEHRSLCYVTMTALPSTSSCPECSNQELSSDFEDSFTGDGIFIKARCLRHSLTTHLVYERVPPFPKFNFDIQLKLSNSICLNTGNALHIFTYNISEPQEDSVFSSELLVPPPHQETRTRKSKARLLHCNFWFKLQVPNCLQKILSNCSSREATRILPVSESNVDSKERNEDCITNQVAFLSTLPFSIDFEPHLIEVKPNPRRLSHSSMDSELSILSTLSRSTNLSQHSILDVEVQEIEFEKPIPSPPKRLYAGGNTGILKSKSVMPPPQRRRKFFKTGLTTSASSRSRKHTNSGPVPPPASAPKETYDVFDVGFEEVLLDRSLSSYRKRRNADKQYEFSDPDVSTENVVPFKLSRNRQRRRECEIYGAYGMPRSPRFNENAPTGEPPRYETVNIGPSGYPRSPRALHVHSPAMSPNYSELGDVLRLLTNNSFVSNVNMSPSHPLFSPPVVREFFEDFPDVKFYSRPPQVPTSDANPETEEKTSNSRPTFTTNLNCIAKILRCYVDKEDDNASVKTDTDDEYNQTVPFPVALNLEVCGTRNESLQLIHNAKVKNSPTPVVEILQRTLEIEILCNEVAGLICLSADKNLISCFDYDVVILDVCPERGNITALAVVLIQATNLNKNNHKCMDGNGEVSSESPQQTIPRVPDPRQKYEAVFSFVWEPVAENCRVLYMEHLRETDTIPDKWHPTKYILQRLESRLPCQIESNHRVLTNELAVYEWQSLDELVDASGLISLRTSGSSMTSNRGMSSSAFKFSSLNNIDTEDEDLSD